MFIPKPFRKSPFCLLLFLAAAASAAEAPAFWSWAPKPPMGWNSYDAFGDSVTEKEVLANADYMKDHLLAHGWNYVVVDFRWYDPAPTGDDRKLNSKRTGAKLCAETYGRMIPAPNRFPSAADGQGFKPLADKLHAAGLKFGFHMMRGIPRQAVTAKTPIEGSAFTAADAGNPADKCGWCPDMFGVRANPAGQAWYDAMFRLYASWGLDFVKVDDLSNAYHPAEIEMIRKAIDRCGRPIVFSTSPGPAPLDRAAHLQSQANMWRISGDFWDQWKKLEHQFVLLAAWTGSGVGGPGHWPDADMIPFGHIAIRSAIQGPDRRSRFTRDEQVTLMSLWAMASSPLMLGGNLPDNDAWDESLLTNDEVIAIDQAPEPGKLLVNGEGTQGEGTQVWKKNLPDGSMVAGLFNPGNAPAAVSIDPQMFGGRKNWHDVWSHRDVALSAEGKITVSVPAHGAALLRAMP